MSSDLLERCQRAAAIEIDPQAQPDDLIGFFQSFRPDGNGLEGLFDDLPLGDLLHQRLAELFSAAGDDRRPTGGRDVYFIV
ncbi:MAG: apolipoprotein acyltransferase, partial [Planctomycetota bacterium]